MNELPKVVHTHKLRRFDNCDHFLFGKNLPVDASSESQPEAVAHNAQLHLLELERAKVSAGCLLNPGEPLNPEQLLYSYSMYVPSTSWPNTCIHNQELG